jgi:hypothetical protein
MASRVLDDPPWASADVMFEFVQVLQGCLQQRRVAA